MMSDFFESFLTPPPPLNPIFTLYNLIFLDPSPPLKSDIIYERSLSQRSEATQIWAPLSIPVIKLKLTSLILTIFFQMLLQNFF